MASAKALQCCSPTNACLQPALAPTSPGGAFSAASPHQRRSPRPWHCSGGRSAAPSSPTSTLRATVSLHRGPSSPTASLGASVSLHRGPTAAAAGGLCPSTHGAYHSSRQEGSRGAAVTGSCTGATKRGARALGCSSFMGQPMQPDSLRKASPQKQNHHHHRHQQQQRRQMGRTPGVARALGPLEIVTGFAVAAGAMAVLTVPLTIAATLVAGTAAMATGLIFAVLTPLLPLALASFGILGVGLPFLWTALDKVLFLAVAFNFAFGVIGLATAKNSVSAQRLGGGGKWGKGASAFGDVPREYRRSVPKRIRRMLTRQGLDPSSDASLAFDASLSSTDGSPGLPSFRKGFWLGPSLLSLVPGIHGAGWLVAFSEWPSPAAARWDMRLGLLRNALIYGGTGLLGLMFGHPFGAPVVTVAAKAQCWGLFCSGAKVATVAASTANGSFWLSLVLGAVHLQLDRSFLRQLAQPAAPSSAKKGVKEKAAGAVGGAGAVVDVGPAMGSREESPEELSKREMEDFDARLRYRTTGGTLGENVGEWSTAEVALWLEDSGFSEHVEAFQDHDISGAVLLSLTDTELREELGMDRLGQRKRLLLLIQQLRK